MMSGFSCDYASRGTSACSRCKEKLPKGSLRLAKVVPSPFSEGDEMKTYFHSKCLFESFLKARATTKIIDDSSDINGFSDLQQDDKDSIKSLIDDVQSKRQEKSSSKGSKTKNVKQSLITTTISPVKHSNNSSIGPIQSSSNDLNGVTTDDHLTESAQSSVSFLQFAHLVERIANDASYIEKSNIIRKFIDKMKNEQKPQHEIVLLLKLLIPGVVKRVYNVHNKQLLKLFASILGMDVNDMSDHLDNSGDVSVTIENYFNSSSAVSPITVSNAKLTITHVDQFLEKMSNLTTEKDQERAFAQITPKCTSLELKTLIRLIKHDLRMNAGAKPVLDALDNRAYEAFQTSRDLADVVQRVFEGKDNSNNKKLSKQLSIKAKLMTPILPMLAEACKSVAMAMDKCPNGMYSEIKYDGERVQVHKQGDNYQYFSRSLKPVVAHKVAHIKEFLPLACPKGNDMILDSEVLLVDTNTGLPLPFGTLGVHKKTAFASASVCLFIFDCILFNDETLIDKPLDYRKKILKDNIKEIPNKIMLSEYKIITDGSVLDSMIMDTINAGLEGLVLKDMKSVYEPGKRHWLKVKKDYLQDGAMADTADLVVLGAYYGTGSKGGLMSSFLMGVYDDKSKCWLTVTKVANGFTDAELNQINKKLKMKKISKDTNQIPHWIKMNKTMAPDFVITDIEDGPVWEITGAEFTRADIHTADGISIRFPRVTKVRDDKSWREATDFKRLKILVEKSRQQTDFSSLQSTSKTSPAKSEKSPGKNKFVAASSSKSPNVPSPQCSPPKKLKTNHTFAETKLPKGELVTNLKNIFTGVKTIISESYPDRDKICRYFIAYDGEVVDAYVANSSESSYIISTDEELKSLLKNAPSGKRISDKWVFDCIKANRKISVEKYLVS